MTEYHTEVFDVPDKTQPPEHEYHHRTDRSRYLTDPEQEWDGDKYEFDERCAKCRQEGAMLCANCGKLIEYLAKHQVYAHVRLKDGSKCPRAIPKIDFQAVPRGKERR